ncbi:hypothetical protein [Streptomyces sp. S1D4-20]|uniref:hypothetical protein n=1 Tax=Streptomyces sp. S1D4-20 TaxID=2594462 RepID=UPI001163CEC7|nr:hypothetical protein [Streptomyces sp. S1D4-20]QDN60100.1 hypothetical protein FNV67_36810 [Streptomyces sp. S1D4-20]
MSENLTLDDLAVPLRALRMLAADFGHLPAPDVHVSTIYAEQLELSFYDDLPGFEMWREALGVDPDAVTYREQGDGRTRVLRTTTTYAGAELELIGYGDVAVPVSVEAGAA